MGNSETCPKCGCTEIAEGKQNGYARIYPVDNIFGMGSNVIYDICTNCGYILCMRVEKPGRFK
ncbi:MAG: transcription initiation factor TFIIIB [Paeniclostridium sordellii]|nr:transcription initiation factor TFIIIB [Paeniclostridium sordellii]